MTDFPEIIYVKQTKEGLECDGADPQNLAEHKREVVVAEYRCIRTFLRVINKTVVEKIE